MASIDDILNDPSFLSLPPGGPERRSVISSIIPQDADFQQADPLTKQTKLKAALNLQRIQSGADIPPGVGYLPPSTDKIEALPQMSASPLAPGLAEAIKPISDEIANSKLVKMFRTSAIRPQSELEKQAGMTPEGFAQSAPPGLKTVAGAYGQALQSAGEAATPENAAGALGFALAPGLGRALAPAMGPLLGKQAAEAAAEGYGEGGVPGAIKNVAGMAGGMAPYLLGGQGEQAKHVLEPGDVGTSIQHLNFKGTPREGEEIPTTKGHVAMMVNALFDHVFDGDTNPPLDKLDEAGIANYGPNWKVISDKNIKAKDLPIETAAALGRSARPDFIRKVEQPSVDKETGIVTPGGFIRPRATQGDVPGVEDLHQGSGAEGTQLWYQKNVAKTVDAWKQSLGDADGGKASDLYDTVIRHENLYSANRGTAEAMDMGLRSILAKYGFVEYPNPMDISPKKGEKALDSRGLKETLAGGMIGGPKLGPFGQTKRSGVNPSDVNLQPLVTVPDRIEHGVYLGSTGIAPTDSTRRYIDAANRIYANRMVEKGQMVGRPEIQQTQARGWGGFQEKVQGTPEKALPFAESARVGVDYYGGPKAFLGDRQAFENSPFMRGEPHPKEQALQHAIAVQDGTDFDFGANELPTAVGLGVQHVKTYKKGWQEGMDEFDVTTKDGKATPFKILSVYDPNSKTVKVEWMGLPNWSTDTADANSLGPANVRDALRGLRDYYGAKTVEAERISGARSHAEQRLIEKGDFDTVVNTKLKMNMVGLGIEHVTPESVVEANDKLNDPKEGGFTITRDGKPYDSGYSYSPYKSRERILDNATPAAILQYAKDNADLLGQPGHNLGGWKNSADGKTYLDVSVHEPSLPKAIREARAAGQQAIYDHASGKEIPVDYAAPTADFLHRSRKQLTEVDPAMMGVEGKGGRDQQQRPDMLPRMYFQEATAKPETGLGPYAHKMTNPAALRWYDYEADPAGFGRHVQQETGLAQGPEFTTAKENAIREAGYNAVHYPSNEAAAVFEKTPVEAHGYTPAPKVGTNVPSSGSNINFTHRDTPEQMRGFIENIASQIDQSPVTHEQLLQQARKEGMSLEELERLTAAGKRRTAQVLAGRQLTVGIEHDYGKAMESGNAADIELQTERMLRGMQVASDLAHEAGLTLNSFKINASPQAELTRAHRNLGKLLNALESKNPELAKDVKLQLKSLDLRDPRVINKILFENRPHVADWGDKLYEYRVGNILSTIRTQVRHAATDTASMVIMPTKAVVRAMMDPVAGIVTPGKGRQHFFGEAAAEVYGGVKALPEAFQAWTTTLKQDGRYDEAGGITEGPRGGAIAGTKGKIIRAPLTMLHATARFAQTVLAGMETHAAAYRVAVKEGLKGADAIERAQDIVANESELSQQREQFGGKSINDLAEREALYYTAQQKLTGTVGKQIMKLPRQVFLFRKTPTNLFRMFMEHSPFGALRILKKGIMQEYSAPDGRAELSDDMAKTIIGTAVWTMAANWAASGTIDGGGPLDPRDRKRWMENHKAYSWNGVIGGKHVHIPYLWSEPFGSVIATAADYSEIKDAASYAEKQQIGEMIMRSIGRNLTSKTWLQGVIDLADFISNPVDNFKNLGAGVLGSMVPGSGALNSWAQARDPWMRRAMTTMDKIKTRLPYLRETVMPARDIEGEKIPSDSQQAQKLLGNTFLGKALAFSWPGSPTQGKDTPITRALEDMGTRISDLSQTVKYGPHELKLDDKGYDLWQQVAGYQVKRALTSLESRLPDLMQRAATAGAPTNPNAPSFDMMLKDKIEEEVNHARKAALPQFVKMMRTEYPEMWKSYMDDALDREQRQRVRLQKAREK